MPQDEDRRLVALYDAHAPSVWRYVVHLTGDPAGAGPTTTGFTNATLVQPGGGTPTSATLQALAPVADPALRPGVAVPPALRPYRRPGLVE